MENPQENLTQDYYYEFDSQYRIIAANTVYSSVLENQIKIDFAVEAPAIPQRIRHRIVNGRIAESVEIDPPMKYVRTVQVSVVLPLSQAERILAHIAAQIRASQGK